MRVLSYSGLLALSLLFTWPLALCAQPLELADNAPERYVVRSGDTLWDIAGRFLRDPWRWRELWRANREITDPDRIYPGDALELQMVDGAPQLRLTRNGGETVTGYQDGMPTVRLSPRARVSSLRDEVPTIPIASIAPFLSEPYIADSDQIKKAPYVVGFPDEHLVAGLHDLIYVRQIKSRAAENFQILRPGDELRDPDSNEVLGYEAEFIANAALERTGDPAKLSITRSAREVSIGDRVIPAEQDRSLENFFPRPAPQQLRGSILSVMNGVSQIGQYDVVIINRGKRDRIESGHLFEVYIGGEQARDQIRGAGRDWHGRGPDPWTTDFWFGDHIFKGWRRDDSQVDGGLPLRADFRRDRNTYLKPYERAGILMVFRVFDRVSFALVLDATRAMSVGDRIVAPPS